MEEFLKKKIESLVITEDEKKPLLVVVSPGIHPKQETPYLFNEIPVKLQYIYKCIHMCAYTELDVVSDNDAQIIIYNNHGPFTNSDLQHVLEIKDKCPTPILCLADNDVYEDSEIDFSLFDVVKVKVEIKTDLDLEQITKNILAYNKINSPSMFVFSGDSGQTNMALDAYKDYLEDNYKYCTVEGNPFEDHRYFINEKGETQKVEEHPELLYKVFLPSGYNESTQIIIYHRYIEQFKDSYLNYVLELQKKVINIPIICLMNEYSCKEGINLSSFDVRKVQVSVCITEE